MNEQRIVTLEEHFLNLDVISSNEVTRKFAEWFPQELKNKLADVGEERLRAMDRNGITVQVLSASPPGADMLDGSEGIRFAREINDKLVKVVRGAAGRFAGFAHLPMRAPQAAADELERAITDLGFRGAMINGTTDGQFLDDVRFAPILERASKLGVPIYLHPNFPPKAVMDTYYSGLPQMMSRLLAWGGFGWHVETAIHVLRLAASGTFEKFPGLKIIVGHMGETLPFMLDRLDHCLVDMHGEPPISPIIRDRLYITTSGVFSTPAFLCALTTFGADRILFSVDYPYSTTDQAVDWFNHLPVAPADKKKIMHGNADSLLRLA